MIINMTPHDIHMVDAQGVVVKTIEKSGNTIRLSVATQGADAIDGVPTSVTVFGEAVGLPSQQDGVYYVVSQLVKSALPSREDLLVPAEMVRDANGQILGCKSLGR